MRHVTRRHVPLRFPAALRATLAAALAAGLTVTIASGPTAASAASPAALLVPASAVDADRDGSITVRKYVPDADGSPSGTPDDGARFTVDQVPDVDVTTPEGRQVADDLAQADPTTLSTVPVTQGVTDARGEVVFHDLDLGLYVVDEVGPDGVTPFLVSLPLPDPDVPGGWLYDVVTYPKPRAASEVQPGAVQPAVHDLALRTWVAQIWREGELVFERPSAATESGRGFRIPHVTFDHPLDVRVGDLLVHDIHVFNQGTATARVEELVNYSPDGLERVSARALAAIPHQDDRGWEVAEDGLLHLPMADAGMVLAPGERAEVSLTLQVTAAALPDGVDTVDLHSFVEISRFSGWVPSADGVARFSLSDEVHDGVVGQWGQVADVDSTPDRFNGALDGGDLTFHSWEDNEIHESNTSMRWDDDANDYDNDEDDHDGSIIQVARDHGLDTAHVTDPGSDPGSGPVARGASAGRLALTGASPWLAAVVATALLTVGVTLVTRRRRRQGDGATHTGDPA